MRLLRFFLVFAGTAILIIGSIYLINRESFHTVFQNREALLEGSEWVEKTYSLSGLISFISEQPQHASIAVAGIPANVTDIQSYNSKSTSSSSFPSDGSSTGTSSISEISEIQYQSGRMIPAGTLSSLFLILSYADQVTSGRLDQDTIIDLDLIRIFHMSEWDKRYINDFNQWVSEDSSSPTIADLLHYYIESRDPAVAGFLYFFLGEERVNNLVSDLGKGNIEPPIPLFGFRMLVLQNDIAESKEISGKLSLLQNTDRLEILQKAADIARAQWKQPRIIQKEDAPPITSFRAERELNKLYPAVQAQQFLSILNGIWEEKIINPETSRATRKLLEISTNDPFLNRHITEYASHFDERMGYLNGWSIARVVENGRLQAQIILLHNLPAGLWFHMNSNFMIRDYHHRLFFDEKIQNRSFMLLLNRETGLGRVLDS